ncbi:MAG: glycosyltransferase [Zoogloeaceae bacterium]|nr:glycosyltransferase [Gammaproteobacteria bacterium]MCP5230838.1 glycosyltransferase [Zoogloeaceae bacterium]
MKRIGLLITSLTGGGAERMVMNFHGVFTRMGHEAHIILVKNEVFHGAEGIPADQLHVLSETGDLHANKAISKRLLARRLRQTVREIEADGRRFDFHISNSEDSDRLARIAGLDRVLIRYRNSMSEYIRGKVAGKPAWKRWLHRLQWTWKFRAIYDGAHIVTVSQAMQHDIVDVIGVKPASLTTIYNPYPFAWLRAQAGKPAPLPDGPYIVYAAKFENRKRHDVLVRAFHASGVPHSLVLIGDVYTDADRANFARLQALVDELGLRERVIFPGFQKNPYPWLKHADLFALSSDSEGLPVVLVEALILGTPAVSTDCPTGPREVLIGEHARFLSPTGDWRALGDNIRAALVEGYPPISGELIERFDDEFAAGRYLALAQRLFETR